MTILMEKYTSPIHMLISRILAGVGTAQDTEECCSDVFVTAWEQAGRYNANRAPLKTWLLMIARYRALDRRKTLLKQSNLNAADVELETLPDGADTPELHLIHAEERSSVLHALEELKPLDKELVYRRYFLFEPVNKMAKELGLTRQAADNRLWRARKMLREHISENLKEEAADFE
ncbi:MAG: sigma-70 family RNA polymerase sigma factor [Bacillota bacterium]|nr:sigma-70 family RNA polymerase sigma factor [Bacillota bacterium]